MIPELSACLEQLAPLHQRLCPRQVLGVRMGLHAGTLLGLDLPRTDKRLLVITETDGCLADGVSVATGCWLGRRTLRVADYGKVAATFVDTMTDKAVRIRPHHRCRERALFYAPDAPDRWHAQLAGYGAMPAEELLQGQPVALTVPVAQLVGRPGVRARCARCGEEIMNAREVVVAGQVYCRGCAGEHYYQAADAELGDPLMGWAATRSTKTNGGAHGSPQRSRRPPRCLNSRAELR